MMRRCGKNTHSLAFLVMTCTWNGLPWRETPWGYDFGYPHLPEMVRERFLRTG